VHPSLVQCNFYRAFDKTVDTSVSPVISLSKKNLSDEKLWKYYMLRIFDSRRTRRTKALTKNYTVIVITVSCGDETVYLFIYILGFLQILQIFKCIVFLVTVSGKPNPMKLNKELHKESSKRNVYR